MRGNKRLFYTPGLISLVGLGICLPFFYKMNIPAKEYCLQLFMPNEVMSENDFSKYSLEKDMRKMRKLKFILDEDRKANKKKMEIIRYEALKLEYTQDSSTVILIDLTDNITYGDFVSIVDMCVSDGHKPYASWDNKFVIFGEWPKKETKKTDTLPLLTCGYFPIKESVHEPNSIEMAKMRLKHLYTPQGLFLFVGFLILAVSYLISKKLRTITSINIAGTPN
jgi:hypothetical protein